MGLYETAVIGTGACGNAIAELAYNKKFLTVMVNSTDLDIDDAYDMEGNSIIKIGEEGAGKIRNNGKKLVKENINEYSAKLIELLSGQTMVIVASPLAGGTDSGSLPITADIINSTMDDKLVIPVGILPENKEDIRALSNAIEASKELESLGLPYILIDNGSYKESIKNMYDEINKSVVEDFTVLRGDYNIKSSYSNMDVRDCKRLFSTPGLMAINKISGLKDTTFDNTTFDELIIKSIKDSFNVQYEKDKIIKRMGIILTVTPEMLDKFNRGLDDLKKEIGIPLEIFIHINMVTKEEISKCSIITILAGLSFPDSRMEEMAEIINESKEALTKTSSSKITEMSNSLDWLDGDDQLNEKKVKKSASDLLSRWD